MGEGIKVIKLKLSRVSSLVYYMATLPIDAGRSDKEKGKFSRKFARTENGTSSSSSIFSSLSLLH
jgi:hypothetical protein